MKNRLNCKKIQILQIFVKVLFYLSGVSLLIWQIHGTFETFIKKRTSFARKQVAVESMVPPTIVFCSRNHRKGGFATQFVNISNADHFNEQFSWINEKLNLTAFKVSSTSKPEEIQLSNRIRLSLGENFDDGGNLLLTIEELMTLLIRLQQQLCILKF